MDTHILMKENGRRGTAFKENVNKSVVATGMNSDEWAERGMAALCISVFGL